MRLPASAIDTTFLLEYSYGMDPVTKAKLIDKGSDIFVGLVKLAMSRPQEGSPVAAERSVSSAQPVVSSVPAATHGSSRIAMPTSDETTIELKRRLAKELYRMELDLAAGLRIAGKPCDCGSNKHGLMLEAAAEELISQDPGNAPVYQDIINWIPVNRPKISPEAIQSGKFTTEYPGMANEFKVFRKRVMGSAETAVENIGEKQSGGQLTLEQAKKLAAEEAVRAVERAWQVED